MLPVLAFNIVQSLELLSNAALALADSAIAGFVVNQARIDAALERNPILITALNSIIGYEQGAKIAKQAYAEGRPVRDVAAEHTSLSAEELRKHLDPRALANVGPNSGPQENG
jgi:fumarate hydratase class II